MPESRIVHYKSFDGKTISALLWVPFNLRRDGSNPALVLPHGGPTGQVQDTWNPTVAALVSRGYICIAPNFRGSTGYGQKFERGIANEWGGKDYLDVMNGLDAALKKYPWLDGERMGVTGGSYGGFMTNWIVGLDTPLLAPDDAPLGDVDVVFLGLPHGHSAELAEQLTGVLREVVAFDVEPVDERSHVTSRLQA